MQTIKNLDILSDRNFAFEGSIITIGNFDGVHQGHKYLIEKIINEAKSSCLKSLVVTFDIHPREYFQPGSVKVLTTLQEKIELLGNLNPDYLIILPFEKISKLTAEEFVVFCKSRFNLKKILVGGDFNFGKDRKGNIELLYKMSRELDFEVIPVLRQDFHNYPVSSSLIREQVGIGNIENVNQLLGYNYFLEARVVNIENSTIDLDIEDKTKLLPPNGLYEVNIANLENPQVATIEIVNSQKADDKNRIVCYTNLLVTKKQQLKISFKT